MNMYTGMMVLVLILAYLMRSDLPENQKSYIRVSCLLMFILCGMRDVYSIGIQTFASYHNTFERPSNYYFQFSVSFIPMVFQTDRRRSR